MRLATCIPDPVQRSYVAYMNGRVERGDIREHACPIVARTGQQFHAFEVVLLVSQTDFEKARGHAPCALCPLGCDLHRIDGLMIRAHSLIDWAKAVSPVLGLGSVERPTARPLLVVSYLGLG